MKDIQHKLIELFQKGYCTPQISKIAKKIKQPSTTIHYNIKKLEKEGAIKTYKAVFDHKKIGQGFCSYTLINVNPEKYTSPEEIAKKFAKFHQVESVDLLTGDWGLMLKIRTKDQDEYYEFLKNVIFKQGASEIKTLISLKQFKTEFVT